MNKAAVINYRASVVNGTAAYSSFSYKTKLFFGDLEDKKDLFCGIFSAMILVVGLLIVFAETGIRY